MTAINDFLAGREQDAWATLRGFKYQIDLSILRWLKLGDDEHLELECGEDIDRVARSLPVDDDTTFHRVLEQVKHRSGSITLRSEEALGCICNAIDHNAANPNLRLLFCYTTNSSIAPERPNPFPDKVPGLRLWEHIRNANLSGVDHDQAIQSIRTFLTSVTRPKAVSPESWDRLQRFVMDDGASSLETLVKRFQWNCGRESSEDLADSVRHEIRRVMGSSGSSQDRVETAYQRLALFVLQLLSQQGIKRLTKILLTAQLAIPTLSDADEDQLRLLQIRFRRLEHRLEAMEDAVSVLKASVEHVAKKVGIDLQMIDAFAHVSLQPPPMASTVVVRARTVTNLVDSLGSSNWLALLGALDEGKSHLAQLVADRLGGCASWIQFAYDMQPLHAISVLRQSFRELSERVAPIDDGDWCEQALSSLEPGNCIVLDDLPRLIAGSPLVTCLASVGAKIRKHGVKVVSTSRHAFPCQLKAVFPNDYFHEETVPRFDETEVVELLQIHGAPAEFLIDARIKLICGLTFGHPLLATVAAQYLRDTHWNASKLMDLVNQQHAATIADETLNRLQITLSESQRELLYRMSLALGAIHDDVVVQLGRIEVEIPRPRETLASLIGAWSQRESPQTSRVSPLLLGLGKPSVPESTFRGCHSVLAADILKRPISPWDAQDAITHLIQADEPDHAGLVFQSLLDRIHTWEVSEELRPLLLIWQSTSLPERMYCGLKLIIRTLQFLVLPKYGFSDQYVLEDLDLLMETLVEEDAASAYVVASFAVLFLSQRDFGRSIRYYQLAMQAIAASRFDVSEINVLGKGHPAEFIWLPILHIESQEDLCLWQDAFDSLDSSQQRAVIGCSDAILGSIILSDRLILIEAEKPDSSRDWTTVLNRLKELQTWAEAKEWDYLVACILKARVNVHGEQLRKPEAISVEVNAFCNDAKSACSSKSIVAGMYGRELADVSKFDDALPWLEYASQHPVAGVGHIQLMSHLAAVLCYGSLRRFDDASAEGRLAIELVQKDQSIDDVEAMKAYGEVTIAALRGEETREAALAVYPIWKHGVKRMFAVERRDDNWKDNFVVFGHVHSFLVNVATTGKKAEFASDGSEYVAPYLGMFFKTAKGRLELYHDESLPSVMWMHSIYARVAGDHAGSNDWLAKADQAIANGPITYTSAAIRGDMVPYLLISGKYAEAIDAAFESARSMVAIKNHSEKHRLAIPHGTTVDSLVDRLDGDKLQLIDPFGIINGVLPAFFRVAFLYIQETQQARADSLEVAAVCRQVSPLSHNPSVWTQAAKLMEAFGSRNSNGERDSFRLADYANGCREIQILSYLVKSFDQDLQSAFSAHVIGLAHADAWYPSNTSVYTDLFTSFVEMYWRNAFANRRFEFSVPGIVEADLASVSTLPIEQRARATLRAVSSSFNMRDAGECAQSLRS